MSREILQDIEDARTLLRDATKITVLTGAGMSAESGVATYRDAQTGLWQRYSPEQLATREAMENRPDLVWSWILHQARVIRSVEPHKGHATLGAWQGHVTNSGGQFDIITQNIDDLHERGGAEVLAHLHGTTFSFRCFDCNEPSDYRVDHATVEQLHASPETDQLLLEDPPTCTHCSWGFIRPDIVLFGEMLPQGAMDKAVDSVRNAEVALVIGTSNIVQPAASLPIIASAAGAKVIEINPQQTPLSSDADVHIAGSASEVLPELYS